MLRRERVLQLANGFGLDLPHPLAGALEDAADFLLRVGVAVAQGAPEANELPLPPRDRLANPPRGVRAELEAAAILVLVHRPHQAGVPFLDQVEERQPAVAVLLGDGNDQAQIAAREVPLGNLVFARLVAGGAAPFS